MRQITALFIFIVCLNFTLNAQKVKLGIDVFQENNFELLKNKKVGLITNPTGVNSKLISTIDILHQATDVNLVALFAPEHGVRGNVYAGGKVDNGKDEKTGLPVYSLYGKTQKPTAEMLKGIDVLVYDIQDIGCRSYTYISTMGLAMEAAGENDVEFVVLDRPNPLGGNKIEGNCVEDGFFSFVSKFSIPYIYGQTCGELAIMLNEEKMLKKKCKLTVVHMDNWKRSMTWEDTGLEWVMTSPHIPHKHSAVFYPVTGILGELNCVSIGVGYTLPFELAGAPWINADTLSGKLNNLKLPGYFFRPVYYKPFYGLFKDEFCQGVQIHITDYEVADLSKVQFYILQELYKLYPEKVTFESVAKSRLNMFDKVCGTDEVRKEFMKNYRVSDMEKVWDKDIRIYKDLSAKYFLYD